MGLYDKISVPPSLRERVQGSVWWLGGGEVLDPYHIQINCIHIVSGLVCEFVGRALMLNMVYKLNSNHIEISFLSFGNFFM